jgi:hypothetical protein
MTRLLIIFLLLGVFSSCSLQKRRYSLGFYHSTAAYNKTPTELPANKQNKTAAIKNKTANLQSIALPLTKTQVTPTPNNTLLASAKKTKANYIFALPAKAKKTTPLKNQEKINAKRKNLEPVFETWQQALIFVLLLGVGFLAGYGLHALVPTLAFATCIYIGIAAVLVIALAILLIVVLSQ